MHDFKDFMLDLHQHFSYLLGYQLVKDEIRVFHTDESKTYRLAKHPQYAKYITQVKHRRNGFHLKKSEVQTFIQRCFKVLPTIMEDELEDL